MKRYVQFRSLKVGEKFRLCKEPGGEVFIKTKKPSGNYMNLYGQVIGHISGRTCIYRHPHSGLPETTKKPVFRYKLTSTSFQILEQPDLQSYNLTLVYMASNGWALHRYYYPAIDQNHTSIFVQGTDTEKNQVTYCNYNRPLTDTQVNNIVFALNEWGTIKGIKVIREQPVEEIKKTPEVVKYNLANFDVAINLVREADGIVMRLGYDGRLTRTKLKEKFAQMLNDIQYPED